MNIIAIDTETERGEPWSVQWCVKSNKAEMCLIDNWAAVADIKISLEWPTTLTIVHNALFDIPVLNKLGIYPYKVDDTMIMAYLLGEVSVSLKTLSYRYLGIEMKSYTEMVAEASKAKALPYLEKVLSRTWDDPCPEVEYKPDGKKHVRFPQNINTKIKRLLKKLEKEPDIDLREKWMKMEYREQVEGELGIMDTGWLSDIDFDDAVHYACQDADTTFQLYPILWKRIQEAGLEEVYNIDMGALPLITEMMENGALLNLPYFTELEGYFNGRANQVNKKIDEGAGRHINPASSKQVAEYLYKIGILGMPDGSTDARHLDKLSHKSEVVRTIQEWREYNTLITRYARALPELAGSDNRVHTKYSVTTTESGRLASKNPNLQNIPVRTEAGRRIKRGFIAPRRYWLVAFDYSQIEMRVAADMSQDKELIHIYQTGGDIHEVTRHQMFGGEPNDSQRISAKTVNFRTLYLTTPQGLLQSMYHAGVTKFTLDDCERFISIFWGMYQGLEDWVNQLKCKVIREGKVSDMFGRTRYIAEVNSSLPWVKEEGLRAAVNHPIQSGAGGILKIAMERLIPVSTEYGDFARPSLHIHDELVWEVEDSVLEEVVERIPQIMENAVELCIPTPVGVEVGINLADKWEMEE